MPKQIFWAGVEDEGEISKDWTGQRLNVYVDKQEAADRHERIQPVTMASAGPSRPSKKANPKP